ncbi:MAG TPA: DUF308 domain-containing protein [Anaerolineaceae bacterium]|nr:DUF308 domain-containing protein [Anaerolineaceae bacterium]
MTTLPATQEKSQQHDLAWWVVLIQGILSILIGVLLLASPGMTVLVLVQFLGIYWLVGGVLTLVSIFVDRRLWGWKLFAGVIGVWAGLSVIQHPLWSAVFLPTVLILLLGIQGIFYGIGYILEAINGLGWGTAILGALSIIMGVILVSAPLFAAVWLVIVLGVASLVGGIASVVYAIFVSRKQAQN